MRWMRKIREELAAHMAAARDRRALLAQRDEWMRRAATLAENAKFLRKGV